MADSYDVCRSCRKKLGEGVPAFAGYGAEGVPLYVGVCCERTVHELATRVYWWWRVDKRCEPATLLWRYMDFAKFVALLDSRALYFARADLLGDPYEGASGSIEQKHRWDQFYLEYFRKAIRSTPHPENAPSDDYVEKEAARLLRDISHIAESDRLRSFVSCWHANDGESEAFWRLYCQPPTPGVAISTTAGKLAEALSDDPCVEIGRVHYIDYRHGFAGFHDRIFWKRNSLSHEAEVRAVISQRELADSPSGISKTVDLTKLLRSVVASPFAPSWFPALLESIMLRFGVQIGVSQSELLSQPFF